MNDNAQQFGNVAGLGDLIVPAGDFAVAAAGWAGPLMLVDLGQGRLDAAKALLPPCPVIGMYNSENDDVSTLDTVIEGGFDIDRIVAAILSQPLAAATVTQVLRLLPSLTLDEGLTVESLAYAMLQGSAPHRAWIASRGGAARSALPGRVELAREDDVLTITLARGAAGNAIDRAMRDALREGFALARIDRTIRKVCLRAEGKAFSLGADLAEFGTTTDPAEAHRIRGLTLPAREAVHCADRMDVHVDGACIGAGLELAAFAAHVTASERAWFQLPELAMGILPGAGGCVSLTRRIGRQRALLMILSGRRISARQALAWGLIDAIVPSGCVDEPA